ncbi:serine/threonine protein kinase [Myxococcota bacterium]|nr:serine/threonine protein kinase [Myxococcota bacterium]MBU1382048.1 serine/threonine protein kinase [Myxococcota bacterium]MBU1497206.1 serine/threonine protein kinase [Myxococcota bacterium]
MKESTFSHFGRYVLLKSLARGGMGQVWLSLIGESGWEKFLAIKKILPDSNSPDALMRFQAEAGLGVRLTHSNLVSVFDVGVLGQEAFMAMELVDGENLRSIWNRCAEKRVPFPLEVVAFIMKEACKGLSYAHSFDELNLIHRDISPPNLMVSYQGELKVLDFGLAMHSEGRRFTKPGIIYGKMPYLSPEQAAGKELSGKSDIYSLGIVFWELITGRRLFDNEKEQNLATQLKKRCEKRDIVPPSQVAKRGDAGLDKIVLSMLEWNEDDRPNASTLITDLGTWLSMNYPGCESRNVAAFMEFLFDEDIKKLKDERVELIDSYRIWKSRDDREIIPGDIISDKYRINRVLGEGGMGKVFEAVHTTLGKKVALKILEPKTSMNRQEAEIRFKREARAASRIEHPSVVNVLDYGFVNGARPFLVMELLEGDNLGKILNNGPMELRRGCRLASQLALGIQAAHEEGLIHRDIKPDNVHIVKDHSGIEQLKIIDFGISKSLMGDDENLTRPGITLGTPEYIAPELLLGEMPSAKADIYSFGAVMFEMFTGRPPFSAPRTETVISDKINGRRTKIDDLRPDLPLKLRAIIEGCLAQEPNSRPSSLYMVSEILMDTAREGNPRVLRDEMPEPAMATRHFSIAPSEKPVHRADSGSWMPLGLALAGAAIFIVGLMYSGRSDAKELDPFANPQIPQTVLAIPASPEVRVTEVVPEKVILKKEPAKTTVTKSRRKVTARKATLLDKAKLAIKKGNYSKAYELARRSARNGGGRGALSIQNQAARMLGLPY